MAELTVTDKRASTRSLIDKGTAPRVETRTGEVPVPGTPVTQTLPLFVGGMLVAAELHDLPNADDPATPILGYKMWSTATGYVWVPKDEADAMFGPADEMNQMIITQALTQGLRVVVPPPPIEETTTTLAPGMFSAPHQRAEPGAMGTPKK